MINLNFNKILSVIIVCLIYINIAPPVYANFNFNKDIKGVMKDVTPDGKRANVWLKEVTDGGKDVKKMTMDSLEAWAASGDMEAQYILGCASYTGQQLRADEKRARVLWKEAADQGHLAAQEALQVIKEGKSLRKRDFMRPLSALFHEAGYNEYFGVYKKKRDYNNAIKWWNIAAKYKDDRAVTLLGISYHLGTGVKKDYDKAAALLASQVKNKDPLAQYQLGKMYLYGHGLEKDLRTALKLFREAGKQGLTEANVMANKIMNNEIKD